MDSADWTAICGYEGLATMIRGAVDIREWRVKVEVSDLLGVNTGDT